jgi:predicted acetyltransferase
MSVQVRLIQPEELGAWVRSVSVPFLNPAQDAEGQRRWERSMRPQVEMGRTWAAIDRGHFVGNAGVYSRTVNLPAAPATLDEGAACPVVPFAAITAVGVHPTHRRQGLLRRLMGEMLTDARDRGEALAGLRASESSIYGRFGFGAATQAAGYVLDARSSAFARPAPTVAMDLLLPAEAAKVLPELFRRATARQPGQIDRNDAVWADIIADDAESRHGASARSYVVAPDGFASYRTRESSEGHGHHGRAIVDDLVAETPGTEAALWRFLLDLDLIGEIEVFPRPVDEPIRARLVDPRQLRTTAVVDGLWLRILDVPAALCARGYLRPGRLVLDVRAPDATPVGPDGLDGPDPTTGRWVLDAGPDGATCRPATGAEATDLVLGLAELSAVLGGGVRASVLAAAERVDERHAGALDVADGLFVSRPAPLSTTEF